MTAAGSDILQPGVVLAGRYRLDHLVGEGGCGVVWAAEHTLTGKLVALKILKPSSDSPMWRQRFLREARAACAVRHPNVVPVHDIIEAGDGSPVLVMDLLQGEPLRGRLNREGTLSVAATVEVMLPVISAVGTAHASGVVHRDLKPENVFLTEDAGSAGVRVLDFGIAKLTAPGGLAPAESLTASGSVIGTIYYMPPEQVYGERDVDHRADIWSLGVMLYECLAGRRPTEGENVGQVLKIITSTGIAPLRDVAPAVPPDLADLVMRMLSREIAQRPHDLREAMEVLSRYGTTVVLPFALPAAGPRSLSLPGPNPPQTVSGDAKTETFEGVGVSGSPSSRGPGGEGAPAQTHRSRAVSRAASVVSVVLVAGVAIAALSVRGSSRGIVPALPSGVSAASEPVAPLSPPASIVAPVLAAGEAPTVPLAPLSPSGARTLSARPEVPSPTSRPRAKSPADGGAASAPSAAATHGPTSPEGIVETPPF